MSPYRGLAHIFYILIFLVSVIWSVTASVMP